MELDDLHKVMRFIVLAVLFLGGVPMLYAQRGTGKPKSNYNPDQTLPTPAQKEAPSAPVATPGTKEKKKEPEAVPALPVTVPETAPAPAPSSSVNPQSQEKPALKPEDRSEEIPKPQAPRTQLRSKASPPREQEVEKKEEAPREARVAHPDFQFTKVHEVRTDGSAKTGGNKALEFEQQYWMYGAVTRADREAREGHYFVVSWENKGAVADIEARFEYRQVHSKEILRTLKLKYPQAKGTYRSIFNVVGDAFKEYGPVYSWKLTLWRGEELVAERCSFVW